MKRTFQPNKAREKKKHGFFARMKAKTGIIKARRKKQRERLTK